MEEIRSRLDRSSQALQREIENPSAQRHRILEEARLGYEAAKEWKKQHRELLALTDVK